MIKIIHTADVQVKNREKSLYFSSRKCLKEIESIIKSTKADIFILAGDLWEYATPTDSERKLIYNHLSKLLSIGTLKELVIMAGNHDLLKDKKQNENTIGNNPLNVFVDLMQNLDSKLSEKIVYINKSKIYQSKVSDKFQYVGYSLEDNETFELGFEEELNSDRLNICLHHGMLKEFVDKFKLPIRKDVYSELRSIETFPKDSLITAGDIHMNLNFKGEQNQFYVYPGSPMEHTHKEGTYLSITDHIEIKSEAENKVLYQYEFDETLPKVTLDDVKVLNLALTKFIQYYTLELDSKQPVETVLNSIKHCLHDYINFSAQCFIKIKSANVFLSKEIQMQNMIGEMFAFNNQKQFSVAFEYDKAIQSANTVSNKAIAEILNEKNAELKAKQQTATQLNSVEEGESSVEPSSDEYVNILQTQNIDDLILSTDQIQKLFASVLDIALKSVEDSDITNQELSNDIRNIFAKEIESIVTGSRRYAIDLQSVWTNGFMKLEESHINLNIPGLTRIFGTNKIGKTTLYNMIRWVITGEVYPDMSKSSAMKNNLIVFNKNDIYADVVEVELKSTINGLPVSLTRMVERKWKNNTTDEQKRSLKWKQFISTVERSFKLSVTKSTGEIQTASGDSAENSVKTWFGETINNIIFMNQSKLEKLLATSSDKLNQMVLDFVGIDYLATLESNLDKIKADLLTIAKPSKNSEQISTELLDNSIFIKKSTEKISDLEAHHTLVEDNLVSFAKNLQLINASLVTIGNIPQQIIEVKSEIATLETWLNSFETKIAEVEIPFGKNPEEIQPVLNTLLIDEHEKIITELLSNNDLDEKTIKSYKDAISVLVEFDLENHYESTTTFVSHKLQDLREVIETKEETISETFGKLRKIFEDKLEKLKTLRETKITRINEVKNLLTQNKTKISQNNTSIKNGYCKECGKSFGSETETLKHKEKFLEENTQLESENTAHSHNIEEYQKLVDTIDLSIESFNKNRDLCVSKSISLIDKLQKYPEQAETLKRITTEIKADKALLEFGNEEYENWKKLKSIKYPAILSDNSDIETCLKLFPTDEILIQIFAKINWNLVSIELLKQKITDRNKVIEVKKTSIQTIKNSHSTALETYQKLLNENLESNKTIRENNLKVETHNNSKLIKDSELNNNKLRLENLEKISLPEYNIKSKEYEEVEKEIGTLTTDLKECSKLLTEERLKLQNYNNQKIVIDKTMADYLLYQKNNLVWKLYSKLIKSNFKEIIFEYYRNFLNSTLNALLEDVPFKLYWNDDSDLYHVEFDNGTVTYQPVQQCSGMETCYLALALVYTIHLLNVKNSISHIFIDEISGTLNDGKDLSYDAKNYKELLVLVLNKFKDKSIFIIDHSIENLFETVTYEVQPSGKNSKYVVVD